VSGESGRTTSCVSGALEPSLPSSAWLSTTPALAHLLGFTSTGPSLLSGDPLLGLEVCNASVEGGSGHTEIAGNVGYRLSLFDQLAGIGNLAFGENGASAAEVTTRMPDPALSSSP
jgi:hypothetical protein